MAATLARPMPPTAAAYFDNDWQPTAVRSGHPRDENLMAEAVEAAWAARLVAPPNPWVGAVLITTDGQKFTGSTGRPGQPHAEVAALSAANAAGAPTAGATLYVTLEPCSHQGRTPPCTDAVLAAGIDRVVLGVVDPDPRVSGRGIELLRAAGVDVEVGPGAERVEAQLRPYLHHRRTKRPFVTLKLAASLDGRTAAPDGTSQWITGPEARADAHVLRAEHDAIMVGAGTVRADNPRLTVRDVTAEDGAPPRQPVRVVVGHAPDDAAVHPCREMSGDLADLLAELGADGITSVMVEGGARLAGSLHREGLVDRYVMYLAPVLFGGDDATPMMAGPGAPTISEVTRGSLDQMVKLGEDMRVEFTPHPGGR